jgi:uncharacterized protein
MDARADLGSLTDAADRVTEALSGVRRLGVAFSGGVDSSLLLALAVRALGTDQVVAVLGVSPSLAAAAATTARTSCSRGSTPN